MAELQPTTFDDIATLLSHLMTNYTNMARLFNDMFYSTTPKTLTLQLYDSDGVLQTYEIPNRASDFRYVLNGEGSPEGVKAAVIGSLYQDTKNGQLYIKQFGQDSVGWVRIPTVNDI